MTGKNWMIAIVLVLIAGSSTVYAQATQEKKGDIAVKNADPLKGLKKASPKELNSDKRIMLDPTSTPFYTENHELIDIKDFGALMSSGDYMPEPYVDNNMDIKAFVLRKATEQEKMKRKQMEMNRLGKNELIGKEAFSFSVTDMFGNKYSLEELKGKVIVMNFWFVECKPCVMEMPELNKLVEKYKNKDVVFLGFATNKKAKIDQFLKTKSFNYNLIADSENIANLYNVNSFPTHVIIDKNSKIVHYVSGLGPTTVEEIDKKIESLLK